MKQEERQLLLIDLCARLPYKTYIEIVDEDGNIRDEVELAVQDIITVRYDESTSIHPYLRPMSNMTEEENEIFERLKNEVKNSDGTLFIANCNLLQRFFHSRHIDNNHLIESGLAIEAPADMYNG